MLGKSSVFGGRLSFLCVDFEVDARQGPSPKDENLWKMIQERQMQIMVVLTKVDTVPPPTLHATMLRTVSTLQQLDHTYLWPFVHAVSATAGLGMDAFKEALALVASDHEAKQNLS